MSLSLKTKTQRTFLAVDGRTDLVQEKGDGALVPTPLENLSSQHSAVFLLGCQVMRLLANCPRFPTAALLPARSIPTASSPSDEAQPAPCQTDFYFDVANQILYLPEAELEHVGHFIAAVVQSMAHVASGSQPDARAFKGNLLSQSQSCIFPALLQDPSLRIWCMPCMKPYQPLAFNSSSSLSAGAKTRCAGALPTVLARITYGQSNYGRPLSQADGSKAHPGTLVEEFLDCRVPSEEQLTDHLLASRLAGSARDASFTFHIQTWSR